MNSSLVCSLMSNLISYDKIDKYLQIFDRTKNTEGQQKS